MKWAQSLGRVDGQDFGNNVRARVRRNGGLICRLKWHGLGWLGSWSVMRAQVEMRWHSLRSLDEIETLKSYYATF